MGFILDDDINQIAMGTLIDAHDDKNHIYFLTEPHMLLNHSQIKNKKASQHLLNIASGIDDSSNPVIIKVKLKEP